VQKECIIVNILYIILSVNISRISTIWIVLPFACFIQDYFSQCVAVSYLKGNNL
jgi:hypothetical protein